MNRKTAELQLPGRTGSRRTSGRAVARGFSGTHLVLNTDTGNLIVHLGPSSYISAEGFSLAKGDALEIIGSKVKLNGQDVLLAREVKKDGKVLTLRDAKGFPMGSRGHQRPS